MKQSFTTTKYVILLFTCFVIYLTAFMMLGGMADGEHPKLSGLSKKQARDLDMMVRYPIPHPTLSPGQVVAIQLTALQGNDASTNEGIIITYNYASPHSKTWTGPLHRFVEQVQSPTYKQLLDFKGYILDDLVVDGNRALQYVVLLDETNEPSLYVFTLRRQRADPYPDCWMTEGIEKVEVDRTVYYL